MKKKCNVIIRQESVVSLPVASQVYIEKEDFINSKMKNSSYRSKNNSHDKVEKRFENESNHSIDKDIIKNNLGFDFRLDESLIKNNDLKKDNFIEKLKKEICSDEQISLLNSAWEKIKSGENFDSDFSDTKKALKLDDNNRLRYCDEFVKFVSQNQWKTRRDRGFAWKQDVFDFIRDVYREWMNRGMMQSDLIGLDDSLWNKLQQELKHRDMPKDVNLPKEADARLASVEGKARERLLESRALKRNLNRVLRAG